MLQRLMLYSALGLVLDQLGTDAANPLWWCVVGLFIANDWMVRNDTWEEVTEQVRLLREQRNNINRAKDTDND